MGWTRQSGRVARDRRRPCLETLETRQLLSTSTAKPASSPALNADGSTNYDQIIGASAARAQYHVDGTGQSVAVIDTGVNYNNAALGGGLGAGHKVVAGVDFTGSPSGVLPTWQHGTGVAGIIGSDDASHLGVAPGVDIVALRVFGDNNQGSFSEIADALQWVVQNHGKYHITAVNLSVSDGGNYTSNIFANDGGVGQQITSDVAQLDALNIPVVVAAGNSFDGKTQGLGFPSVIPATVSVTATDASDVLASDAQRLGSAKGGTSAAKLAAPGVGITGPSDGNNFTTEDGSSFAAPQVTGSIVLLQQMYEDAYHTLPTIAELDQLLQQGAVTVHDGVTGINVGRLDVLNSAKLLGQQIAAQSGNGSGGSSPTTPPPSTPPPSTPLPSTPTPVPPPSTPQTQVILNGISLGSYSTAQLAAQYPGLFSFLKGPVTSLRIWAPKGSTVNLGAGSAIVAGVSKPVAAATVKHPAQAKGQAAHATTVGKAVPVVHLPAAKHSSDPVKSFFSSLFPFKF